MPSRFPPLGQGPRRLSWIVGLVSALICLGYLIFLVVSDWPRDDQWLDVASVFWVSITAAFCVPVLFVRLGLTLHGWMKQGYEQDRKRDQP